MSVEDALASHLHESDVADPVTHDQAVELMELAKSAGYIFAWNISIGTGASFVPSTQVVTDRHLYDVEIIEDERRKVLATKIVVFIRGLLNGDTQADVTALREEYPVAD